MVKTGTTNNNRDAWTLGYTPNVSVGVWAGNNDNVPMRKGGAAMAGPIWNKFMNEALKIVPDEKFEKPNLEVDPQEVKPALRGSWQGNGNFFIDKISGKLATEFTPKETLEERIITNVHSILYWVDRDDITGPPPADPYDNSQFERWDIPIQNWWAQNKFKYPISTWGSKPIMEDDVHTAQAAPVVSIIEPNGTNTYSKNQKITLKISNTGRFPLQKIDIFVNNIYLETRQAPFNFSFTPSDLENIDINNELRIVAYDSVYNRAEATATFQVE